MKAELPKSWKSAPLGDVCKTLKGKKPKNSGKISKDRTIPYINIKAFETGIPAEYAEPGNYPECSKNDVLIVWDGARSGLTGRGVAGYIGSTLSKIWSDIIDSGYLYYFLQSQYNFINTNTKGVGIPHVDPNILYSIDFPVAPENEQKRIVAEIEKQFSRLDEAVGNLKRVKANLKRYKASVLKAAVEGKLTEEWRKKHPDVEPADKLLERILAERRKKWEESELAKMKAKGKIPKDDKWKKKYKEPVLPSIEGAPEFPASWYFVSIEQILPVKKDAMKTGPFGSLLKKHEHRQKGIQVLGIENIQAMNFVFGSKIHIDSEKAKELVGYRAVPGDILISRSGTVGEVCVVPYNIGDARISTNLMKLSLEKDGMLPQFFTFLFNGSPFILNQVSDLCKGSTRNFLNQDILKKLVFILPPLKEQRIIIQEVEKKFSIIDGIEKEVDRNLIRADRLRQSVLKKAFSGKLIDQNSNKSLHGLFKTTKTKG